MPDTATVDLMVRHSALLERVAKLERALERVEKNLAAADEFHDRDQNAWEEDRWRDAWAIAQEALSD
jgi:hypothetical protein